MVCGSVKRDSKSEEAPLSSTGEEGSSATPGAQLGEKGPMLAEAKKGFYTSLDVLVRVVRGWILVP